MMTPEKHDFYALAARRFKAELKLYGATAAVHLENKNDELFWGQALRYAYPSGKFRFVSASRSFSGNIANGCSQCLQYRDFLDEHFWIAIDSDYRYLNQEPDIDANHFILQTYTYSFENHFCYGPNLNQALRDVCDGQQPFDFVEFLEQYSRIIYPLFVWQLYLQGIDSELFPKRVFHRLLSLQVGANSTRNNGKPILDLLKQRVMKMRRHFERLYPEADPTWYEARCNDLGVTRQNAYLFVRGHQLYDLIVILGRKVWQEWRTEKYGNAAKTPGQSTFEHQMTHHICFGEYDEIRNLVKDVHLALGI